MTKVIKTYSNVDKPTAHTTSIHLRSTLKMLLQKPIMLTTYPMSQKQQDTLLLLKLCQMLINFQFQT